MSNQKKTYKKIIDEIIIPIEKFQSDTKQLFVFIESYPELDPNDLSYKKFEISDALMINKGWTKPQKEISPEWQTPKYYGSYFNLETLSHILWFHGSGGNLFQAEYTGNASNTVHQYPFANSLEERVTLDSKEHIESCINREVKATQARLIRLVDNLTPFLLWTFALDCIERYYEVLLLDNKLPQIYSRCIEYARVKTLRSCGIDSIPLAKLLSVDPKDKKSLTNESVPFQINLIETLQATIKEDYSLKYRYFEEALLLAIDGIIFYPLTIAANIRHQHAMSCFKKFREEYQLPGIVPIGDTEESRYGQRAWFAFQKQELDWQVNHLQNLLNLK